MIDPITQYIIEIQTMDIVYHASPELVKVLKPNVSPIGKLPGKKTEPWEKSAVYAASEEIQAVPFGLERVNMLWPNLYTKEEVDKFNKGCYLSKKGDMLQVHYYNHTPTKPLYMYELNRKDFKPIKSPIKDSLVEQWYSPKPAMPVNVRKLFPRQVRSSWTKISKKEWEFKKKRYEERGWYK